MSRFLAPTLFAVAVAAVSTACGGGSTTPTLGLPTVTSVSPDHGPAAGGTLVTVTGTNFVVGNTFVNLYGAPVVGLNVASTTSLSFTTPPGPTGMAVSMIVSTSQTTATFNAAFFYTPTIDAVVGSRDGDYICVFKDVLNHALLGADVVLDPMTSGISNGGHFDVENDWLAVACRGNNTIQLFSGFSTLTDNQAPTASLPVSNPSGIDLAGGDIYVCNRNTNELWIFRDVSTMVTGDGPDVVLSAGFNCPVDCLVVNDVLYVADRCNDLIAVWNSASTVASGAMPDAVLPFNGARRLQVADNVLWASSSNNSIIAGYSPADALMNGQAPSQAILGLLDISSRTTFQIVGNQALVWNSYDMQDVMLSRIDLANPLTATAEVKFQEIGFTDGYDCGYLQGAFVLSAHYNNPGLAFYLDGLGITDGQAPDGYVFDFRLSQTKDIKLVAAP